MSLRNRATYRALGATAFVVAFVVRLHLPVVAADATPPPYVPPPVPTADPNVATFDDVTVHFAAPAGWTRVERSSEDPDTRTVAFVQNSSYDSAVIRLVIAPSDSNIDAFDTEHEQSLRTNTGYIERRAKTTLANGKSAYYLVSSTGTDVSSLRRYELIAVDGRRSILLSESARRGFIDDAAARRDLGSFAVVAYPDR